MLYFFSWYNGLYGFVKILNLVSFELVIKTCNLLMGPNENKARERWLHETDLMTTKIHHLNIVRGIRVQPDSFLIELTKLNPSGMPTLITEYCAGGNLRQLLKDSRNASGMIESDVRHIFESLKNATFYLHSLSIIHRDIKPENIAIHLTSDGRKIYKVNNILWILFMNFWEFLVFL